VRSRCSLQVATFLGVRLRLRRERFLVGLRGLALLRGWPFDKAEVADAQLDAVRSVVSGSDERSTDVIDVDELPVGNAYAAWSETYDGPNPLIEAEEPVVRRFLDGIRAGVALDVASGTGRHARLLGDLGHRVIALDASSEMLVRARSNAPGAALVRGDLNRLPIHDQRIDVLVCALALTHVRSLRQPVTELARVLRPGGHLILSDIHPVAVATGAHAFFVRPDGSRGVTRNEIHWASEYVSAFRAADLMIEQAAEPPFEQSFVEHMPDGAIRDAAREAVVGLPFALVWRVRKAS
jgi:ubiquinone/menaquinone biosynthesis C-methylase UbiE